MTPDFVPSHTRTTRPPRSGRWLGLIVASILLHAALLDWAAGYVEAPARGAPQHAVFTASLQQVQAASEPPVMIAPKPVAMPAKRKPRPAPTAALPSPPPETSPQSFEPPIIGMAATDNSLDPAEPPPAEPPAPESVADVAAATPDASAPAEPAPAPFKVIPPPSAELKYDVQALREGQTVYGHGKLSWQSEGNRYTASGEAGILFFSVLTFKSEGEIDDFGVAPVVYNEKRFRKAATNTHFHRERNTISFSASTASYPRSGGEQDRATVIWQLVGIGRGDNARFSAGAEIELFVAGVRDAEVWRIQVVGEEEIAVGGGTMIAWHVSRAPRAGSYDQRIDIWLAPQQEWYPVKVRYTETNGDYLDMSLSSVTLAATH